MPSKRRCRRALIARIVTHHKTTTHAKNTSNQEFKFGCPHRETPTHTLYPLQSRDGSNYHGRTDMGTQALAAPPMTNCEGCARAPRPRERTRFKLRRGYMVQYLPYKQKQIEGVFIIRFPPLVSHGISCRATRIERLLWQTNVTCSLDGSWFLTHKREASVDHTPPKAHDSWEITLLEERKKTWDIGEHLREIEDPFLR